MSLYPNEDNWISLVDDTYSNMLNVQNTYNKDVMVVEIGFNNSRPDITYQFIVYMIERTRQAQGLGVFYWEPIGYSPFTSYSKGAWDDDGSPSVAMDALLNTSTLSTTEFEKPKQNFIIYPSPSSDVLHVKSLNTNLHSIIIVDFNGRLIQKLSTESSLKSIDVSSFAEGIYFVRINHEKTIKWIKK
jgi:hypothetical protein